MRISEKLYIYIHRHRERHENTFYNTRKEASMLT